MISEGLLDIIDILFEMKNNRVSDGAVKST